MGSKENPAQFFELLGFCFLKLTKAGLFILIIFELGDCLLRRPSLVGWVPKKTLRNSLNCLVFAF